MPVMPRCLLPCMFVALAAVSPAEERDRDQPYQGMDVIGAVKAVQHAVSPDVPDVSRGKPWENDIAALTASEPRRHNAAIAALIRRGPAVLPDLAVLAQDRDWQVRKRVARVAAYIGTEAGSTIVLNLSHDDILGVCEEAAMGLGYVKGPGAFPRLAELISAPEPNLRRAVARGLGTLGDVRGFDALLVISRETDDLARRAMREALLQLAQRPETVPALAERIARLRGADASVLVDISGQVGDPRLCPALTGLVGAADADLAQRAARSLAANGDSRAIAALCRAAEGGASSPLASVAAATLRQLTGYEAAPGAAWRLWWQQHEADVARIMPRDAFLADLHDPARTATAEELARFPIADLAPLLDGALGSGPPWWPSQAFKILAADDARRWTPILTERIQATPLSSQRLPIILILDQLGDPAAAPVFQGLLDLPEESRRPSGPERVAIDVALERRNQKATRGSASASWK